MQAFLSYGTKQLKADIAPIRWDLRISSLEEVVRMEKMGKFQPELIRKIELPNCSLTLFHVGSFPWLEVLDLSNNKISNVRGNGMEQCVRLYHINLSNNLISRKENLKAFW